MTEAVIVGYVRSPFQFATKGALATVRPDDLAAHVVKALLERTGVDGKEVEDLILGCAFPEGEQGFNLARVVVFLAGLPQTVAGTTVNRFCGSSMQAIHMAAGAIKSGAGQVFIAAGVESMTRVPMMGFNPLPNPALMKTMPEVYISMGDTAENLSQKYQISRADQEKFALESHHKAARAEAKGKLPELVPIPTKAGEVKTDGTVRGDTSLEKLATLKPAFRADGVVTAGTSSPLTDGAAATLVVSEEYAKAHGLKVLARIKSMAVSGCAPEIMGIGPVPASQKALERAGLAIKDIDLFELNEAFAVQTLSVVRQLGIDEGKMNPEGGAVALGHPMGASGARITGKAAQLLAGGAGQFALASMCIGGGQGITTILEAA